MPFYKQRLRFFLATSNIPWLRRITIHILTPKEARDIHKELIDALTRYN